MGRERAIGRAEAFDLLTSMHPEDIDSFMRGVQTGPDGEWDSEWRLKELREYFRVDDAAWSLLDKAQGLEWDLRAQIDDLQQQIAHPATAPSVPVGVFECGSIHWLGKRQFPDGTKLYVDAAPSVPAGWVPVSERLPEPKRSVLVYRTDGGIQVDSWHLGEWWTNFNDEVTHWSELPARPDRQQ